MSKGETMNRSAYWKHDVSDEGDGIEIIVFRVKRDLTSAALDIQIRNRIAFTQYAEGAGQWNETYCWWVEKIKRDNLNKS